IERVGRGARLILALGHYADQIPVAHHGDDAGHGSGRALIDSRCASSTDRRSGDRSAREAIEPDVRGVACTSGHDVARLDARKWRTDVPPATLGQQRLVVWDRAGERRIADKFRVAHALAVAIADRAVLRVESFRRNPEAGRRAIDKRSPRERSRAPERRCLLRYRVASERAEVERHLVGVAEHDAHALDRHVELVRDELSERGSDALAELDLAGERGQRSIGLDADALFEIHLFFLFIAGAEPPATPLVPAALCTALIARP